MKKISIYIKGNRQSTAYYRIYQYFDNMNEYMRIYHTMMSDSFHDRYMPISRQPICIKVVAYVHIYIRMFMALLSDCIRKPDYIVIHKRVISRFMPKVFNMMLRYVHRHGVKIMWDFDDHIVANHEVTQRQFDIYSELANTITVTHDYLRDLVKKEYRHKVVILPTTDGDMYSLFRDKDINSSRLRKLSEEVSLVWVGTSVNLDYLRGIVGILDKTALDMKAKDGRKLSLRVVCDKPLEVKTKTLEIVNIKWSRSGAIATMRDSQIGIMPLVDDVFTKGKGGFKLVQYISIGLPCIGSNVGFNSKVITNDCGVLVSSVDDWEDAIFCVSDKQRWLEYSNNAFRHWNEQFSYERNLTTWRGLLEMNSGE